MFVPGSYKFGAMFFIRRRSLIRRARRHVPARSA